MNSHRAWPPHLSLIGIVLLVVSLSACAHGPEVVHVGPPQARYDHNRTCLIQSTALLNGKPILLPEEAYTPRGYRLFPSAEYASREEARDGLPTAHVVPTFTGVELPLSWEPRGPECPSDRKDLVDFLAAGPLAQAGIREPDTMGALPQSVESQYRSVLALLESAEILAGGRQAVIAWAEKEQVRWTDRIVDSRYGEGAFAGKVAVLVGDFWFVLTSFNPKGSLTRLLVVPKRPKKQKLDAKTPGGG